MLFGCMWLVLICSLSQTGFRCGGFILEMEYFIRSGWCWQFCSAMLLYYSDLVNIKQHFTTYCWKLNMFWSMFLSTSLLQVRKHTHLYSVWMLLLFFSFLNEHVVTFDYTPGLHIDLIPGLLFVFLSLEKARREEEGQQKHKTPIEKQTTFYQVSSTVRKNKQTKTDSWQKCK